MYGVVVELWPDPVNRQIYYQLPAICHTVYKYTWLDNYGMWAGQTFINGPSPWRLVVISNVILKGGRLHMGKWNDSIQIWILILFLISLAHSYTLRLSFRPVLWPCAVMQCDSFRFRSSMACGICLCAPCSGRASSGCSSPSVKYSLSEASERMAPPWP